MPPFKSKPELTRGLSKQEIDSHSSALTNQRINELFKIANMAEIEVNSSLAPTIQQAVGYHSILVSIYNETSSVYDADEELYNSINDCVKNGITVANYLKQNHNAKQGDVIWLVNNCTYFRQLIHRGLQKQNYFFRIGRPEPKGIKAALEIFKQADWKNPAEEELEEDENQIP